MPLRPLSLRPAGDSLRGVPSAGRHRRALRDRAVRVLRNRRDPSTGVTIEHLAICPAGVVMLDAEDAERKLAVVRRALGADAVALHGPRYLADLELPLLRRLTARQLAAATARQPAAGSGADPLDEHALDRLFRRLAAALPPAA